MRGPAVALRRFINGVAAARLLAAAALLPSLPGCEAPLVLDEVAATQRAPVRRTDNLQAVSSFRQTVAAVGSGGVILVSEDNGNAWRRHEIPSRPSFLDVTACADGMFAALAFENEVWLSRDGGRAWEPSRLPTEEAPQAVQCDPAGNLWVVGAFSTISVSRDGGGSWALSSQEEDVIYTDVQFFDEHTAYVVGEFGSLLKTANGGESWEAAPPMPGEFYPQGMYFETPQRGWVAGLGGTVLATANGGASWTEQNAGALVVLYNLARIGGRLLAVGGEGAMFHYDGTQWAPVAHGQPFRLHLRGLHPLPGNRLIVSGPGGVLRAFAVEELLGGAPPPAVLAPTGGAG